MKTEETFSIGTFNLARGAYPDVVEREVAHEHERGAIPDVLMLQEVTDSLIERVMRVLGDGFRVFVDRSSTTYDGIPDALAMVARRDVCDVLDMSTVPLPRLPRLDRKEVQKGGKRTEPWQCIAQIARLRIRNTLIRIANVHLECYGGGEFKARQLAVAVDALHGNANGVEAHILGGDLNTPKWHPFVRYPHIQAVVAEAALRRLEDVKTTSHVGTHFPIPHERFASVQRFLARTGFSLGQKLDYLFGGRNLEPIESGAFLTRGSDHHGVFARVRVNGGADGT